MITYIERNSWTNLRTGKNFEKLTVHHKSGNTSRILRYDPLDELPKTVKEYLEQAKVVHSYGMPGDGIKTNRKYERLMK